MQLDLKTVYSATSVIYIILGILISFQSYNYRLYIKNLHHLSIGMIVLSIGLFFSVIKVFTAPFVVYLLGDVLIYTSVLIIYYNIVSFQGDNRHRKSDLFIYITLIILTSVFTVFHPIRLISISLDSLFFIYFFCRSSIILIKYSYKTKNYDYLALAVPLIINASNSIFRFAFAIFQYKTVDYWSQGPAEIVFMIIYFINFGIFILGLCLILPNEVKKTLEQSILEKEAALGKNKLLIREMNHRVKNNLTTIQGLLQLQSHAISDQGAKNVLAESASRIKAISDIHTILSQNTDIRKIDSVSYFYRMVEYLKINFQPLYPQVTIKTNLEVHAMDIDILIPIALMVNELLTNAYKHAFDPGAQGTIELSMKYKDANQIELMVKDSGKGLPEGFKSMEFKSFGMDIITSFVHQLEGKLDFQSEPGKGTTVVISFPNV